MRLRLQTKAPLPELKAWFAPHPDNVPATVSELKLAICRQIPALRAQEGSLLLLLDDFELLDDNPLDVVRDGDLIHIKPLNPVLKAQGEPESPPPSLPSKPSKVKSVSSVAQLQLTVPPGYGKPQTHSRNLRRRLKKKYDQAAPSVVSAPPPKNSSTTNTIPLGPRSAPAASADEDGDVDMESSAKQPLGMSTMNEDSSIMMSTLRNKNKRKGFKQSMAMPLPPKIVFDAEVASGSATPSTEQAAQTLMTELPGAEVVVQPRPRLVPPSEKQERNELPPRMFVTSVDVEEGMTNQRKKKKQKQAEVVQEDWDMYEDQDTTQVQLDYSEAAVDNAEGLNWERAEKGWDKFTEVKDISQLAIGTMVGWKALALNPLTFSPEVLLSVASVVRMDPNIVIKQFSRLGGSNPSLSHRLVEPEEEEIEEEECSRNDILANQWRIVEI
ncbi:hypothetical protein C0991_003087 [Blastosporella zonata]|nr:hypothetical protein C0991_003087 [Blastosporella zonata]